MDFKKIAAALVLLPAFVALVGWAPVWAVLALVLLLVVGLGTYEYSKIILPDEPIFLPLLAGWLFSGLVCIMIGTLYQPQFILFALSGGAILIGILFMFLEPELAKVIDKTAKVFFGVVLLGVFGGMIVALKSLEPAIGGYKLLLTLFALTWVNDSGAYFAGVTMGKHKIAPRLSPNKTVEGNIGGFLGTILLTMGIAIFTDFLTVKHALVLGSILGVIGPLGDLFESALKRGAKVKDSGLFMPGHGGVFDRVDSVLFCVPVLYFYVIFFKIGLFNG